MTDVLSARAAGLACWKEKVDPQPLSGGLSNSNFVVDHQGKKYVVRLGEDVPVLDVSRAHEVEASRAAHRVGLSPEVIHAEPGAMVLAFVDGKALTDADVRQRAMLERILPLLRRCHHDMAKELHSKRDGWIFRILAKYDATLREHPSPFASQLDRLQRIAQGLESQVPQAPFVFGHNDLVSGNWIDDGKRLWLIDWEYSAFNSPLFDLGAVASNSAVGDADERWLLESYFDRALTESELLAYASMKCASLLREAMWGMVMQVTSSLTLDYAAYANDYLKRFEQAYSRLQKGGTP